MKFAAILGFHQEKPKERPLVSTCSLPTIRTDRLLLRAFLPSDAEDVFRACSNPVLGHDAGWPPHATLEDSLFYINEVAPLGYVWAIVEPENTHAKGPDSPEGAARVIGSIGFLPDPRTPDDPETMMLGYWMAQDRWNCGFTTEAAASILDWAFSRAGLSRITACHFLFNEASRRVLLKCGFTPLEEALWVDDDAPADEEPQLVQWYELVSPVGELQALSDAEYADFQAKLTPNVPREKFIGVRVPVLRRFAKDYGKTPQAEIFLQQLPHGYYDEDMLHCLLISQMKDYDACVAAIDAFLPYVDNWAVCDIMAPKVLGKQKDRLLADIKRWVASEHTYTCRFGLEMLMTFFLDDDFRPELLEIPAQVNSEEYYVRMMVAWFFATALTKQWMAAVPYIELHRLDDWTHRKTIQKACESRVITPEQKAYLKSLKELDPACPPAAWSAFVQNTACKYYPCHEGVAEGDFNCALCYCPLYVLGEQCGGAYTYTEQGVKDCSACTLPHQGMKGAERAQKLYPRIAELASRD